MRWIRACGLAGAIGIACGAGCASHPAPAASPTARVPGLTVPLVLQGQDTQFRLNFPPPGRGESGQFQQGEICYLNAGDFRIDCYTNGSYLTLGPNDSNALLSDHVASELSAADGNRISEQAVQLYGVIFLVGGSVERLPQTLSDYLQDPGTHLNEAVSLAKSLLGREPVELPGHARGGSFSVTVLLTDAGRDKLIDALDNIGESGGDTQRVRLHAGTERPRPARHVQPAKSTRMP